MTYYADPGRLGKAYARVMDANPHANVGVVGLGAGRLPASP